MVKHAFCTFTGLAGAAIASAFGGWDASLQTLVIVMIADYLSGLIVAGVFKKSKKTDTGALESRAGWKGLCRKGMTLLYVLIATRLDILAGTTYIRDAVCIGYIVSEVISITENAGLMGVPVPAPIAKAIDILKKKLDEED